eukprot:TRINITY_DN11500_c0_g1_i1.p1 TRINITY_DN11500_c0_g1~~TRINITY_DN11500_c0_g1_i1.p1  ORF type:complete len:191 (-),score=35.66 TRINITY_DN11500_c0_g1_i1:104-676(-)
MDESTLMGLLFGASDGPVPPTDEEEQLLLDLDDTSSLSHHLPSPSSSSSHSPLTQLLPPTRTNLNDMQQPDFLPIDNPLSKYYQNKRELLFNAVDQIKAYHIIDDTTCDRSEDRHFIDAVDHPHFYLLASVPDTYKEPSKKKKRTAQNHADEEEQGGPVSLWLNRSWSAKHRVYNETAKHDCTLTSTGSP